jgi:TRAP-type uncharacterized transport system fused permease subunit
MFVLDPAGQGLLLTGSIKTLANADWLAIGEVFLTAVLGVVCLAGGLQGWFLLKTNLVERWLLILAGLALMYPGDSSDLIGLAAFALGTGLQLLRRRAARPGDNTP